MNRYGLTEREKAIWPPKKEVLDSETKFYLFLALTILVLSLIVHFGFEPKIPTAHADTKVLSDKEQEKQYCAQLATGEKKLTNEVSGSVLAAHCAKFL